MSKTTKICKWLLELLKKEKYQTLAEIEEKWLGEERARGLGEMSQRNFHRYKEKLLKEYGVKISCNRQRNFAYFISNPEIFKDYSIAEWMLNTLAVDEKLHECISMTDRIRLEPIPSGGERLDVVTDAMLRDKKLGFVHQKYGSVRAKTFVVGVCGLILYNHRWYILGEFEDKQRFTFSLDRLWDAEITSEDFEVDPDFDVNTYFGEIYGIFNSGKPLQNIVLRAFGNEAYLMRDLPIHPSQREIGSGKDYADFMIRVRPNNELIGYILSRKNFLKVLSPESVVEDMKNAIRSIADLYEEEEKI